MLRINLLGPLQVTVNGHTADFRTDALRVLLAYLAAHHGTPQRRDTLAGLLSPDRPNKEARTYLRNRLARLRKAIADGRADPAWLTVDRKQIGLRRGDDIAVDTARFDQLLTAVHAHPHRRLAGCPTCLDRLREAVDLVRGELLAGLNFPSDIWDAWLIAQREHYQQRALEAMAHLRDAHLEQGEWTAVLDIAQRQLRHEPWLEAAHRAAMRAHAHLGDRTAALAQYEQCARVLAAELGVEPEEETLALHDRITADALTWADPAGADNLPPPTDKFIGRTAEQAQLLQRLVDPAYRLITLVGTGGIGKTRLALEVARQVKTSFPDGVWVVDLGAVDGDAEQIAVAIGETAGLGETDRPLTAAQVPALLRDKRLLLLLDNCESVLDHLDFLSAWLRRAPHLAVLATSRQPLNFQAETVVGVDGLPTGQDTPATAEALFAQRAQMARADFDVSAETLPHVRRICELVDGSPLGISLAAAWVRRRSLPQIVAEIGRSLDFLRTRMRDIDPRHRSMRAVFETSWQLLDEDAQAILAALSLFPTTFTAEAAAQVAGAELFDLDLLCEKSLLQQHHRAERYGLHALVRQFAAAKLGQRRPAVAQAFVDYFVPFARAHRDDYTLLQPEWRNLSAAVSTAEELGLHTTVIDLVRVLDRPWFRRIRFHDMRAGLTAAVAAARAISDPSTLAPLLLRRGEIEMELNDYEAAETSLTEALRHLIRQEEGAGIAQAKYLFGRIKNEQAQDAQALALFTESQQIFAEEGDGLGVAKNLNLMAVCEVKLHHDFETAHDYLQDAARRQQARPLTPIYVETLRNLGRVQAWTGNESAAERTLLEAADVSRRLDDLGEYAAVLYERVLLDKRQGRIAAALGHGYEGLAQFRKLGSLRWEGLLKTQLGLLHQQNGETAEAETLLREGLHIFQELGDLYEQAYSHYYLHKLYAAGGDAAQSARQKAQAEQINQTLGNAQLAERLAET